MVQWDDIPESIQMQIYLLQKELDEWNTFIKDNQHYNEAIISINNQIDILEKPYIKEK